jgi:two-component system sensor kinase
VLASISLIIPLVSLAFIPVWALFRPTALDDSDTLLLYALNIVLLGVFFFNRAGYFRSTTTILIVTVAVTTTIAPFLPGSYASVLTVTVAAVVISAVIHSPFASVLVAISTLLGAIFLTVLLEDSLPGRLNSYVDTILVLAVIDAILVGFMYQLQHLEGIRRQELETTNQKLRESEALLEKRVKARTLELEQRSRQLQIAKEESDAARETAEEKARELESFTYSVSHDLRSPLRALDGFSKRLLEHHSHNLSDEAKYYLTRIHENSRRMGQLIDDLLALSRIGRTEMSIQQVDPKHIVEQILGELRADEQIGNAQFIVQDLPPCLADPRLLRHVYSNLISNAIKYSRDKDSPIIEVGAYRDIKGQPVYYVKDNGIGFDMQFADKLFGVFQRLHSSNDYEGTGIGLATAQRVIKRHHGRIWADGKPNEGSTFHFSLNRQKDQIYGK